MSSLYLSGSIVAIVLRGAKSGPFPATQLLLIGRCCRRLNQILFVFVNVTMRFQLVLFFPKQFTVRGAQFFLKMCPPFVSLLVSALFRWPCSISIHLSPRSVAAGVRPFPLAIPPRVQLRFWDVCISAGRGLTVPGSAPSMLISSYLSRSDMPRFTPALLAFVTNPRPHLNSHL